MAGKKFKFDWGKTMEKIKEKESGGNNYKDERIYYPQFNDNGTASAIIRFLRSPDTDVPYVSLYNHGFSGNGWYIENCPTTIKKECPVCQANNDAWNNGDKQTARSRARRLNNYCNILVVKDPANPENEGKVFLFRYGKKIHGMIMEKISPDDGVSEPVMVFDYYDGANFKLIIKKIKVDGKAMPNYDSCAFEAPKALGTDAEIEKVHNQLYGLADLISEDKFKDFETLQEKFNRVVGVRGIKNVTSTTEDEPRTEEEGDSVFDGTDDEFFQNLENDD